MISCILISLLNVSASRRLSLYVNAAVTLQAEALTLSVALQVLIRIQDAEIKMKCGAERAERVGRNHDENSLLLLLL